MRYDLCVKKCPFLPSLTLRLNLNITACGERIKIVQCLSSSAPEGGIKCS